MRVEVGKVGVGVEGDGVDYFRIGSGTKGMGMQIDSSIGEYFHDFPSIDVHKPVATSFQNSMTFDCSLEQETSTSKAIRQASMDSIDA